MKISYKISLWISSANWFHTSLKINDKFYHQFNVVSGNTYERTHFTWDDVYFEKNEYYFEVQYRCGGKSNINTTPNGKGIPYA